LVPAAVLFDRLVLMMGRSNAKFTVSAVGVPVSGGRIAVLEIRLDDSRRWFDEGALVDAGVGAAPAHWCRRPAAGRWSRLPGVGVVGPQRGGCRIGGAIKPTLIRIFSFMFDIFE